MKSYRKIVKKTRKRNLGIYNKELVIRLVKQKGNYHIILTRRRSKAASRYDKLGYVSFVSSRPSVLGIDRKKFKNAISLGASVHVSVYKILLG